MREMCQLLALLIYQPPLFMTYDNENQCFNEFAMKLNLKLNVRVTFFVQAAPYMMSTNRLVNALVLSHVRYCLAVFGNGSEKNIQRLQKVLNFALRTVSGQRKFEHISDVREELGWPTARQLYEQHSLNFLHKICCTGEPEAFSSQLQVNSTLRSRSTRQDADLALPRVRTEAGRRRLLFSIVQLYNRLPPVVRDLSLRSFKRVVSNS